MRLFLLLQHSPDISDAEPTKLMKILYDCVSSDVKTADHPFGKFETFMSSISLEDRDTLIFAVKAQT